MTSASATPEQDTQESASGDTGPACEACPHPWADHDAIGRRFCSASSASARTDQGCVCRAR